MRVLAPTRRTSIIPRCGPFIALNQTRHSLRNPTVDLLLRVPGQRNAISCAAEVVRQDLKRDGTVGLALRFLPLDWTELLGLARLVSPQLE